MDSFDFTKSVQIGDLRFPVSKRRLDKEKHACTLTLAPAIVYIEPTAASYDAERLPDNYFLDEHLQYLIDNNASDNQSAPQ